MPETPTLGQRRAALRVKVAFYTARATRNQLARWGYWSRRAGCRSVGRWLEGLADREVRRMEEEAGVWDPPESQ